MEPLNTFWTFAFRTAIFLAKGQEFAFFSDVSLMFLIVALFSHVDLLRSFS